ncbi:hypothetical protein BBF96_06090 [Anoxybacter fermentans]|uniref:DUF401 family protein n=1 Tax=Anoxybacter fermentans TaxID=1323375 RepID=A0A3S9SXN3_9FIRM|nr:DUF401 family protein [Anoxybacter fermentans]AZR73002.1 hypothetical protein BBF96_06090 [Anoxybacter fermentans]
MEIIGLLIAFVVIIGMVMKRINLGIAMFTGSIIIGLTSPKIGLTHFFEFLSAGLFSKTTLELVLVIINIGIIANLMDKTGLVDQMIGALSTLFRKFQIILAVVPSVMGALAIPGGAMLSAPMVNSIAKDLNLSNRKKMAINLLFRHIWYFVFPFTPGLILAAGLLGRDVFYLIRHLAPLTIVLGVVGFITLFRGMENSSIKEAKAVVKRRAVKELFLALLPLLVGILLPFFTPLPFWGALSIGIVILVIYKWDKIEFQMIWQSIEWKLSLGILGIMVFREFINNLDALYQLAESIINAGMPIWFLAVVLPGLVGFLTGSTSGAIGITFPLLIPFISGNQIDMGYVVLMYGSAFFSYYISPVHFCLILTAEYFGVTLKDTYKELFWPTLAGIGMMVILFFIY